jgi:phenylacetate-coenzyme A ligase PaaK-like adenylate-forming protein
VFKNIFNIKSEADFQAKCLETFLYQYENVEVYRKFVDFLGKNPSEIKEIKDIPFLPIEMFKNHLVLDKVFGSAQTDKSLSFFQSSGTEPIGYLVLATNHINNLQKL